MSRNFVCALTVLALLLGAAALLVYPLNAGAQQPQDPHLFEQRMSARIDAVQMRIRNLEKELAGETPRQGRTSEYDGDSGLLRQLEELDKRCRELEREIDSIGMKSVGPPVHIYEQQRQLEYYVRGLERQVQQIRRWMQAVDDDADRSVEPHPTPDTEEDGISDEDWAADWAKGKQ
jgi:TolA-binding protein